MARSTHVAVIRTGHDISFSIPLVMIQETGLGARRRYEPASPTHMKIERSVNAEMRCRKYSIEKRRRFSKWRRFRASNTRMRFPVAV